MRMTDPFSFQLYSARSAPPVAAQLEEIAKLGFRNVEPYRTLYDTPAETRRQLDANGLTAKTGHFALAALLDARERNFDAAQTLGIETVIVPSLPIEDWVKPLDGWKRLGAQLETLREAAAARGLGLGWHNHHFDLARLSDGSRPLDHILGDNLLWEADIAWIARAGEDPSALMARFAGRVFAIHVKDIAPAGEKPDEGGWADPGQGVLDWDRLWQDALRAGARIAVAEHDAPSDVWRFARNAMATLRALDARAAVEA